VTVQLRLFAAAREAAGRGSDEFSFDDTPTLGALLDAATHRYGGAFDVVLKTARVWVNGEDPTNGPVTMLTEGDEVAVLPPVSGG
jgi:MoaD family protein